MSDRVESVGVPFWGDVDDTEALQRYRTLVDTVDDGIYQLDAEGHFVGVNDMIVDATGYSREELLGEHVSLVLDDADIKQIKHDFRQRLEAGEDVSGATTYETTVKTADGKLLTCELQISLLLSDGTFQGSIGVVRDVTERKRRERHIETELDDIVERITDGFFSLDTDWNITHINERAKKIIDAKGRNLVGKNFWEEFPEIVGSRFEQAYRRAMETQEPTTIEEYYPPLDIWFEDNIYPSETGLSVYFQDITERKEGERKLAESERRSRTLIEHFPNGAVGLFDENLQYTAVGGEVIEDLEESADEIVGQSVLERYPAELADRFESKCRATLSGERTTFEFEFHDRHWYACTVPVEDDEGDVFGGMVMVQDITDRKEIERDLRESEARFRMVAESLDEIVWMVTPDTREFLYVNPAYEDVYGRDRKELYEDRYAFVESLHPEDRERVLDAWEQLPDNEWEEEFRIVRPDGEVRWINARAGKAHDKRRGVTRIVGIAEDVTERKRRERELERNKEQLETLFEVLPVGVVVAEADGEIVEANDTAHEIWGGDVFDATSVEEYEQYPVKWADSGEWVEPEEMTLARVLDGEEVTEPDILEIDAVDGERRIVELEGMPIRDETGEVTRGVVTMSDISERRKHERALEESERRYRTLAEHFPNGVVGVYDHDLRYTLAAGELIDDPAPSREEVEGTRMPDLYPDDVVADLEPLFRAAIEDGETGSTRTKVVGRQWQVWATPLRNADDEIFAGLSFAQDITEQIERERELERALALLEKTENIADVGGWEVNPETMDVFWTDHIFKLLEVDADEEPPLDEALDMYYEDDQSTVEGAVENALESGESFDVEVRVQTYGGEVRWLRLQGVPETDGDEVVSLRGAAQDVTERKQREQRLEEVIKRLEESNERLEQFAYAASHDLQEPLRMVSSYLQLLERRYEDALDEDGEEYLAFAVDGADRMREMIDGLLKYSRIETQGDPFEPVELDDILNEVRDDLQVKIERSNAEITADDLPRVDGDASQLRQVFQNLLENAIEYSGDEPPRVHVSAERDGSNWIVSVRDEGLGIDPKDADRVFEVFQRLHSRGEHSGTGIGLALCERIVERHGGEIWVDSEPGEGATFSFRLPTANT